MAALCMGSALAAIEEANGSIGEIEAAVGQVSSAIRQTQKIAEALAS